MATAWSPGTFVCAYPIKGPSASARSVTERDAAKGWRLGITAWNTSRSMTSSCSASPAVVGTRTRPASHALGFDELQHLLVGGLPKFQLDPGVSLAEGRQEFRQQRVGGRADEPHAQAPDVPLRGAACSRANLCRVGQAFACRAQRLVPCLGEANRAAATLEEFGPQFVLELADGHGQRRLRHVEALGRAPKAERLGHGDELVQLAQLHPYILCINRCTDGIGFIKT
jgi:hypothetical protein